MHCKPESQQQKKNSSLKYFNVNLQRYVKQKQKKNMKLSVGSPEYLLFILLKFRSINIVPFCKSRD